MMPRQYNNDKVSRVSLYIYTRSIKQSTPSDKCEQWKRWWHVGWFHWCSFDAHSRFTIYRHIWIFLVRGGAYIYRGETDKMLYEAEELTLDFRALLSPRSLPRDKGVAASLLSPWHNGRRRRAPFIVKDIMEPRRGRPPRACALAIYGFFYLGK